jgi:hypothetical protein
MLNNYRYPIALFLASFIFFLTGVLLRTMHFPVGNFMTICMVIFQVISILWLMILSFKSNYPTVLFLAGFILFLVGLAFKIQHWPGGQLIISCTIIMQIIAIAWLIISLLKDKAKA